MMNNHFIIIIIYFISADIIARLCAVVNSAINFMIYCMFGSGKILFSKDDYLQEKSAEFGLRIFEDRVDVILCDHKIKSKLNISYLLCKMNQNLIFCNNYKNFIMLKKPNLKCAIFERIAD